MFLSGCVVVVLDPPCFLSRQAHQRVQEAMGNYRRSSIQEM